MRKHVIKSSDIGVYKGYFYMLSRKLICFIWNGWGSNKKMASYTENTPLVRSDVNVLGRSDVNVLDLGALDRSDVNVLEKRYIESLDELDRIALNVARSTLGSLFSLEKSNHYMEWKSAQCDRRTEFDPSANKAPQNA